MQKRVLFQIIPGLVGIFLIVLMVRTLDLPMSAILDLPAQTPLWVLPAAAALTGVNQLLGVMKWKLAAAHLAPGASAPNFTEMARITTIGTFFGQLIPTPLSMALTRWLLVGKPLRAAGFTTRSTFYEQAFDVVIVACSGTASLVLFLFDLPVSSALIILVAVWGLSLYAIRFLLDLCRRLATWLATGRFAAAQFEHASQTFALTSNAPVGQVLAQSALSLMRLILQVLRVVVIVTTFIPGIGVLKLFVASPAVILVTVIPITPGGLGIVEWSWSTFLISLGATAPLAALVALVFRVFVFLELAIIFALLTGLHLALKRIGLNGVE